MSFPKFVYMTKNTPLFSNFARFCTPKRCTRGQCLVLKNNPNYVNFWTSLILPLTFECPPRPSCAHIRSQVVPPSAFLSSPPPLSCPWLPFSESFGPSVVISPGYMPCPSPFGFFYFLNDVLTSVLFLISEFLTV